MEFRCTACGGRNQYTETDYPSGSTQELPCRRCGEYNIVHIPVYKAEPKPPKPTETKPGPPKPTETKTESKNSDKGKEDKREIQEKVAAKKSRKKASIKAAPQPEAEVMDLDSIKLPVYDHGNNRANKSWLYILIGLLAVGIAGYTFWKFSGFSSATSLSASDRDTDKAAVTTEEVVTVEDAVTTEEAVTATETSTSDNSMLPSFHVGTGYLPSSYLYESTTNTDFTDYSLGDNWKAAPAVINSENEVAYTMRATGTIKGDDIRFEAVLLRNGRIYGRYNHSNGTKLDVNGFTDEGGNLQIKLGHGSATSYWCLNKTGEENNVVYYEGTWGKKDSPTTLSCVYTKSVKKASPSTRRTLSGALIADDGKRYPFKLSFDKIGDEIANAEYENADYHTKAKLTTAHLSNGEYYFSGKLGNDQLTIRFSSSYPYEGKMISGNKVGDIQMNL